MRSRLRWKSRGTLALLGLLLVYALLSVKRSELKPLWFDELGTLNVASQPTLAGMFRVEPADGNPPLQYLLVRPSLQTWGENALALRLPAMVAVGLGLVCAYFFVGRRFGAAAGLLAPTLLLFSRVADYGVEARPYGVLMGLTALLLVCWQRAAADKLDRGAVLAGVAASLFALTVTQPMGLLWGGLPLLAGETGRWWRVRQPDRALWSAIAIGFSGFGITAVFGHATQDVLSAGGVHNHSAIALPTLAKFAEAVRVEGFPPALALLAVLGTGAWWTGHRSGPEGRSTAGEPQKNTGAEELGKQWGAPLHEWIAVSTWALTIFAVYLFTCLVTHYFWARYIVPGAFGCFLLVGMVCGSLSRRRPVAVTVAVGLVGLCLLWAERRSMVARTAATPQAQDSVTPVLLSGNRSGEPIVIGKPFFFPEIWWYASPALRQRLHYIADPRQAARTTDFVPEMTLLAMHRAGSALFPPDSLNGFLTQNRHFLLWHHTVAQGCWLEDYLRGERYSFTPVASDSSGSETLYEISAPVDAP